MIAPGDDRTRGVELHAQAGPDDANEAEWTMRTPTGGRWVLVIIALLAAATFVVWVAALLFSMPPPPPSLVVQAEPLIPAGGPVALRVTAVRPRATTRSQVAGELVSGDERTSIVDGVARLKHLGGPVTLELRIDDELSVRASLPLQEAAIRLGPTKLLPLPWRAEVQTAVSDGPRVPLYPLDGRVSARLASRVLFLEDNGPRIVEVEPRVQGALLPDGRVVAVDRSGLRVEAPLEVDAESSFEVRVWTAEPRDVGFDLLVDGALHDVVHRHVDGVATIKLSVGAAHPGDVVVVHAGGTWPDQLGRSTLARIRDPSTPLGVWLGELAARAGAPADEPLLSWIRSHASDVDDDVVRAALGRFRPGKLRAPRVAADRIEQAPLGPLLRRGYAALAAALVTIVLLTGLVRLPGRRLAAVWMALGVGLLVGGLHLVLVVLSASAASGAAP